MLGRQLDCRNARIRFVLCLHHLTPRRERCGGGGIKKSKSVGSACSKPRAGEKYYYCSRSQANHTGPPVSYQRDLLHSAMPAHALFALLAWLVLTGYLTGRLSLAAHGILPPSLWLLTACIIYGDTISLHASVKLCLDNGATSGRV